MLKDVDPVMASRWHVNQTRRVRRSLEVFYQTGVQHSELIARQASAQQHTEKLFDACAFWIHCQNKKVLAERLAKRVDTMMETGLVDEIQKLRAQVLLNPPRYATPTASRDSGVDAGEAEEEEEEENGLDYSVGILQAIGYKEFAPYLEALDVRQQQREDGESDDLRKQRDAALETLLQSCIEQLNIATRQYARRQLSWIRNRFVPRNIPVYQVDSSDITRWTTDVATPAIEIATAFLQGEEIKAKTLQQTEPGKYTPLSDAEKYKEHVCAICGDRKFVGTSQWEMHLKSKGHKFHVRRIEMEKERPRWEQFREAKKAARQEQDVAGDEEPATKESE
jgi:tRNA dimethylallyltransferase